MAIKIKRARKGKVESIFPFERINYIIMGLGLTIIIVGYILLSRSEVKGFVPLVLSPILLVLGYCVLIPLGIMYRRKEINNNVAISEDSSS